MKSKPSEAILRAFLVSNDTTVVKHVSEALRDLAAFTEVCSDAQNASRLMAVRKFEGLVVDFAAGEGSQDILRQVRLSRSNRNTVAFAVTDGTKQSKIAFEAGANFVLERPLSAVSVGRTIKAAYALLIRERLRYFRFPISFPTAVRQENAKEICCDALNVSEGGIAINTPVPLQPGSKVTARFTLPGQATAFAARCEVCWYDQKSRAGLQFLESSSEQRSELKEWLARKLEASMPESVALKFQSNH